MKRNILLGLVGVMVAACGTMDSAGPSMNPLFGGPPPPPPQPTTYSGRATVLSARVLLVRATIGDTGPLSASGGAKSLDLLTVQVPGIIGAGVAHAETQGGNDLASSEATVANVSLGLLGVGIAAQLIGSHTGAVCEGGSEAVSGGSDIAGLVINGQSITVTGAPNQTIQVPGGRVVINEQTRTSDSITISALRVVLNGLADVVVSQTHSDIHCGN